MAGELLSATSNEQIEAIVRGAPEIGAHHVIIGGRSGSGYGLAQALAGKGEAVLFTHSGMLKETRVAESLDDVREAFINSGASGNPEVEVITIGGDATTVEHRDQIARATSLWLPENTSLSSLTLAAARGVEMTKPGAEVREPDPNYARKLNVEGILGVLQKIYETETDEGRSLLNGAAVLYPASTASHQWEDGVDSEQFELYGAVGPTKYEAEQAIQGPWKNTLSWVDARAITIVMGKVEGTMVARQINRRAPQYLDREDVQATTIDIDCAGKGMAEVIANPTKYPNGSVVHILPKEIVVEALPAAAGGAQ